MKNITKLLIFITLLIFILIIIIPFFKKENNNINVNQSIKDDSKTTAKLTLVGDFLFEQPFYDAISNGDDKEKYFNRVKNYFINDDLSIGNMEVVIGNENLDISGTGFSFCAPMWVGNLVNSLDLEVLSTANNHANDRGYAGIKSSLDFFAKNTSIMTVGTSRTIDERNNKHIKNINGIKFGFISYTYGTNKKLSEDNSYAVNIYRMKDTLEINKELIKNDIDNIKDEVDVIIAIIHFGIEFTNDPNNEQIELANYLNSLGVDIIVGSHSHSIQPIEWIGDEHKTLVYYSLGNFVSADDDISRTGEKFDNAYQFGLLSTLNVTKENNKIIIDNIKTIPIINYFNQNMRNFELIPYSEYSEDYETTHYRYPYNFNKEFIKNMYEEVIDSNFR